VGGGSDPARGLDQRQGRGMGVGFGVATPGNEHDRVRAANRRSDGPAAVEALQAHVVSVVAGELDDEPAGAAGRSDDEASHR
jgi:hypothetical protein